MINFLFCCALALFAVSLPAQAQQPPAAPDPTGNSYLATWFHRVDQTQAAQPHWITPVATTTPRLEEEFRFDTLWQTNNQRETAENFGGSKGLEFIPTEKLEVILSVPPYLAHRNPAVEDGFGDFQFLLKYRLLSKHEGNGNYILTAFFGVSLPTGQFRNGATDPIVTPTIAYGKGFANLDLQGTLGISLPTGNEVTIGRTIPWNNAFQYRLHRKFWPEIEVNYTHFQDGPNNGKTLVFLTPGLVIGKVHLWRRLGLTFGGEFQIAATRFHPANHNGILTVRFPF